MDERRSQDQVLDLDPTERRRFQRQILHWDASFSGSGMTSHPCKIRDFCPGGLFLAVDNGSGSPLQGILSRGDRIIVRFAIPSEVGTTQDFQMVAAVARVFDSGLGVAFVDPDPDALRALRDLTNRQQPETQKAESALFATGSTRERILAACKAVFERYLDSVLSGFCERAEEQLFASARDAKSNIEQTDFFDGRTEFNGLRKRLVAETTRKLLEGMDNIGKPVKSNGSFEGIDTMNLSLMEKDEFEDFLVVSEIISKAEQSYKDPLRFLTQRFSQVISGSVEQETLPIGPGAICRGFSDVLQRGESKRNVLKVIYDVFDSHVVSGLGELYKEVNQILIDSGILPELENRPQYSRPRPKQGGQGTQPMTGGQSADRGSAELEQTISEQYGEDMSVSTPPPSGWAAAREVFDAVRSVRLPRARADMAGGVSSLAERPQQFFSEDQIIEAISGLQQDLPQSGRLTGSEFSDQLQRLLATRIGSEKQVSVHQMGAIDMVGHIVDSIDDDQLASTVMRKQVRGLQGALSRVAVADEGFLNAQFHPTRRAINQLADLDAAMTGGDPLRPSVDRLMAQVEQDLSGAGKVSDHALLELDRLAERQAQIYRDRLEKLIQQCESEQSLLESRRKESTDTAAPEPSIPASHEWGVWIDRAKRLEMGDGMVLKQGSKPPVDTKLAWVGKDFNPFVFVDGAGNKVATMTLQELAMQMHRGNATTLDTEQQGLMERAVRSSVYRLHDTVEFHAQYDPVTGLLNRTHFTACLQQALDRARQEGVEHVLAYGDLNCLALLRERWGEKVADALLKEIAQIIEKHIDPEVVAGRLVDDKFAFLLERRGLDDGLAFADGLVDAVSDTRFQWEHQKFRVSMALGLVVANADSGKAETLLEQARSACKEALREGGKRIYAGEMENTAPQSNKETVDWSAWLDRVVSTREMQLFGQPMVSLVEVDNRQPLFEVWAGLQAEDGRVLLPNSVLEPNELKDKVREFERLLIDEVLRWMASDAAAAAQFECCAINLSGHSLTDKKFLEYLLGRFSEIAVPPGKVCFQIAQETAKGRLAETERVVRTMKEFGCRFALDEFGGEDLSGGYLDRLPVDYLCIDGVFVQTMLDNPDDYAVIKSINSVGHLVGKKTVAKGVGNDTLMTSLAEIGVDYAQGSESPKPLLEA